MVFEGAERVERRVAPSSEGRGGLGEPGLGAVLRQQPDALARPETDLPQDRDPACEEVFGLAVGDAPAVAPEGDAVGMAA